MSDIRANTISDTSGNGPINLHKQSAAKAWANFKGTGTAEIRASLGVSVLTDNGEGAYTLSYTTSFKELRSQAKEMTAQENDSAALNSIPDRHIGPARVQQSVTECSVVCMIIPSGASYIQPSQRDVLIATVTVHGDLA